MNSKVQKTEVARWLLVAVVLLVLVPVTWMTAPRLSAAWGETVLSLLVDVSAVLFGVFGIWLGMFYHPDVCDARKGKAGAELADTCRMIISNARRFDVVFKGVKTSAVVLVFSMTARIAKDPVLLCVSSDDVRLGIKFVATFFIYCAFLFQAYAVVTAVVPMMDARRKMQKARRDAEDTLSL